MATETRVEWITSNLKVTGKARYETLEGASHIVVPVVAITEGVHEGSQGALYYPADELAKGPEALNHKPAVVYHPERDGKSITACDPTVLSTRKVGVPLSMAWNAKDAKLKGEAWLNVERLRKVDNRILTALEKGEKVEVSTGLYLDIEYTEGTWKDEKYVGIARNYRWDHLAILPDQVGACSIADGGGLLANAASEPEGTFTILRRSMEQIVNQSGLLSMVGNEMSFSAVSRALSDLLAAEYGEKGKYWDGWIESVYSDRVIFYPGYKSTDKPMLQKYTQAADGVKLDGRAVEVTRVVEYRTKDGKAFSANSQVLAEESSGMFDKKVHVDKLIGNGFDEADRGVLMSLDDKTLEKIQPKPVANSTPPSTIPVPPVPASPPVPTPPPTAVPAPVANVTFAELLANADPATKELLSEMGQAFAGEKGRLVAAITANKACKFTPEQLNAKPIAELRLLAELAVPPQSATATNQNPLGSYLGAWTPPPVQNAHKETPLPLPGAPKGVTNKAKEEPAGSAK